MDVSQPLYLSQPDRVEQLAESGQVRAWPRWDEDDTAELPGRVLPFRVRKHLTAAPAPQEAP